MNSIDSLLNNGKTVHFYPEGSLWLYYDKIRHFKNGAFDFAVRNNVPIIPMVFKFDKQKKISNLIKPKTIITLEILKPVYPNKLIGKKDAILQLKEDVKQKTNETLGADLILSPHFSGCKLPA